MSHYGQRQQTRREHLAWIWRNIKREWHNYWSHDPYEFSGGANADSYGREINKPKLHWWQRKASYSIVYVQAIRRRKGWNGPVTRLSANMYRSRPTDYAKIISVDDDHFTCEVKISDRVEPDSRYDLAAFFVEDAYNGIESDRSNVVIAYVNGEYCKTFNNWPDNYGLSQWDDPYLGPVFASYRNAQESIS